MYNLFMLQKSDCKGSVYFSNSEIKMAANLQLAVM